MSFLFRRAVFLFLVGWLGFFQTAIPQLWGADKEPAIEVSLELTYPVGRSPKVLISGWHFGARCIVNPGNRDLSEQVRWSGTGEFSPAIGARSQPAFSKPGASQIHLEIEPKEIIDNSKWVIDKRFPLTNE